MKNLKILEWNIHHQGRKAKKTPLNIVEYIMREEEDVIILLEVNTQAENFEDFCEKFNEKGYRIYMACYKECNYANDMFIAVNSKSNIFVKNVDYHKAYHSEAENKNDLSIPENLFLDIEINGKSYVIGGVRIKELDSNYPIRKKQMETLISWNNEIDVPIILLGDFNNLRENTPEQSWNLKVLDSIIERKFIRKTPEFNCSWGVAYYPQTKKYDGYIKEDKLLLSTSIQSVAEVSLAYYWDYLSDNIDGSWLDPVNQYGRQKINVPIGIPDHAILKVRIPLE